VRVSFRFTGLGNRVEGVSWWWNCNNVLSPIEYFATPSTLLMCPTNYIHKTLCETALTLALYNI
jgi:hypothetical protein